ncbi:MAG: phosphoenolpyruvate carboxylase [Candidatus Bathyarchaeota archaeon]|nr:MAG: phosphoenolpyruvate carboxylase [Candidatus Bathyarchaeota archaeon]
MRKIPSTMSTQHPDNVALPPWVEEEMIAGESEVHETYFAFEELRCEEQMWDWEGKDVDPNIVRKLLVNHPDYFKDHLLGRDVFLTYRVPNPSVEVAEKKLLIEALESIPRCYDVAEKFYGKEIGAPVFEVIVPFTTSHLELLRVTSCYSKIIVGKEKMKLCEAEDVSVEDWVGGFKPKSVEMIPLIEDRESLSNIDRILIEYIKQLKPEYLRVFLARSDPALNYGLIPAVLLVKLALSKIQTVSKSYGVKMLPIIGTGSLPFRGHLMPDNLDNFLREYAGVRTVTIQSALKYDFDTNTVQKTVERLNTELRRTEIKEMSDEEAKETTSIIDAFTANYQHKIEELSEVINYIAKYVPNRRARKLHVGLFGYSREVGTTQLPRAIKFTAAMYSLGIPPELVGASALANLSERQFELLEEHYINWKDDLKFASLFLCWQNLNYLIGEKEIVQKVTKRFRLTEVIPEIMKDLELLEQATNIGLGPRNLDHRKHENMVNNILISLAKDSEEVTRYIVEAGRIRHSLG